MTKGRSTAEQLSHLRILNQRGRVALFVGAGVSFECGLPNWNDLTAKLMRLAFHEKAASAEAALKTTPNINKTRLIKTRLKDQFNKNVAKIIYSGETNISKSLTNIVRSGIRHICTFNFDDLIEEAMQIEGIQFKSIEPGEKFNNNFKGTTIFHPHGMLPASAAQEVINAKKIVLSEDDYNEMYSSPYAWANLVQVSLLMNYTCLFVGVSFTDPNLRRLLDTVRTTCTHGHYAIMRSPSFAVAASEKEITGQIKASIDIDLSSFNVQPIWVRRYDEIPDIFKSIRRRGSSRSAEIMPTV